MTVPAIDYDPYSLPCPNSSLSPAFQHTFVLCSLSQSTSIVPRVALLSYQRVARLEEQRRGPCTPFHSVTEQKARYTLRITSPPILSVYKAVPSKRLHLIPHHASGNRVTNRTYTFFSFIFYPYSYYEMPAARTRRVTRSSASTVKASSSSLPLPSSSLLSSKKMSPHIKLRRVTREELNGWWSGSDSEVEDALPQRIDEPWPYMFQVYYMLFLATSAHT